MPLRPDSPPWPDRARQGHQTGSVRVFVRVEEASRAWYISELRRAPTSRCRDQVVAVGDDAMVKVIDIDLSVADLAEPQAGPTRLLTEEFDLSLYGMADSYDELGQLHLPRGLRRRDQRSGNGRFRSKQRTEWGGPLREVPSAGTRCTFTQMEKFVAAEVAAAERPATNGRRRVRRPTRPEESAGGLLASDAQPAALREKLAGNA